MNEKEAIKELKSLSPSESSIETVLNLIEKQKHIIEGKEALIDTMTHNEEVYEEILEKKDKVIHLMAKDIKEADKFLDSMGYLGEYEGYTIEGIIEEYNQKIEKGE